MAAEIRIYFEGHRLLEAGFSEFFRELRERAKEKRCRFQLISSKSGEEARRGGIGLLLTRTEFSGWWK